MSFNTVAARRGGRSRHHGSLTGLTDDDHAQYALLAGRSGGQTLIGSTVAGEDLTLQGSAGTGTDRGWIVANSLLDLGGAWTNQQIASGNEHLIHSSASVTAPAGVQVKDGVRFNETWTVNTNVFVYNGFYVTSVFDQQSTPVFSAFALFNAGPRMTSALTSAFGSVIVNAVQTHEHTGAVAQSLGTVQSFVSQPLLSVTNASGTMNAGSVYGLNAGLTTNVGPVGAAMNVARFAGLNVEDVDQVSGIAPTFTEWYGVRYVGLSLAPATRSAALYSTQPATDANHRSIVTTTSSAVAAAPNEFIGGGQTIMDGLVLRGTGGGTLNTDQDDWDGFGWGGTTTTRRSMIRAAPSADIDITGFDSTNASDGQVIILLNVSLTNNRIRIRHNSANSLVNNRIFTSGEGEDLILRPNDAALFVYETFANKWRCFSRNPYSDQHVPRWGFCMRSNSPTISADQDDWDVFGYSAPAGHTPYAVVTTNDTTARTVSGFTVSNTRDGQFAVITNGGTAGFTGNIILGHQDTNSIAANRIISPTGSNYTIAPGESAILVYNDVTVNRWRIVGGTGT